MERGTSGDYPSVYCFNSYFYNRLSGEFGPNLKGHESVKRWTREVGYFLQFSLSCNVIHIPTELRSVTVTFLSLQVDIYNCDLVLIPVNLLQAKHWVLCVVLVKEATVLYYDSKGVEASLSLRNVS